MKVSYSLFFCCISFSIKFRFTYSHHQCNIPHCVVEKWSNWSPCSEPCGISGLKSRTRKVFLQENCSEKDCSERPYEIIPCNRYCLNGININATCVCNPGWVGECCEKGPVILIISTIAHQLVIEINNYNLMKYSLFNSFNSYLF